jgi:hypothetical protein
MIKPTATIAFRRLPRIERDWPSPVRASGLLGIVKTAASGRVRDHVAASSPFRPAPRLRRTGHRLLSQGCARCDRWRITSCWRRSISQPCSHTASDATDFCWFRICFHNYAAKTPSLNVRLSQGDEP